MVREDCDGVASQANVASACPGRGMLGTKERGEENVLCCHGCGFGVGRSPQAMTKAGQGRASRASKMEDMLLWWGGWG